MKRILLSLLSLCNVLTLSSQDVDFNIRKFNCVRDALCGECFASEGELVAAVALQFLDTPYVTGSIEGETEELRVFLDRTDCILFVEMCTSFALTLKSDNPCYDTLVDNIRQMRYRNGNVGDYASRIHYTSEWLMRGEFRGILKEYTRKYGNVLDQKFNFMSTHPQLYPSLRDDNAQIALISVTESFLENYGPYWSIDRERLLRGDVDIREGDIVCFVSATPGLDISHVAIAHAVNGEMCFIHASSVEKKVVISTKTIADCARNGVRLARLK